MEITKSSRHSKIIGEFGEHLVLYWLSKYGFECARVDHTGIDIIARNPHTKEVMGISVKSRSRSSGTEGTDLTMSLGDFDKARKACDAFNCVPYFAVVIDEGNKIYGFILSMAELLKTHREDQKSFSWKMRKTDIEEYRKNSKLVMFEFAHSTLRWFNETKP